MDFDATDLLMIIYSTYVKYLKRMGIQPSIASDTYKPEENL